MTNATQTLATQNESWGFWGTMKEEAPAAWAIALPSITTVTGCEPEQVRAFLDSRHGRHFADEVQNHLYKGEALADAIHAAIQQWMSWRTNRLTNKDYGIPSGLPYLTGFVIHCEIMEEMAPTEQ
jgi:hypothetical protein